MGKVGGLKSLSPKIIKKLKKPAPHSSHPYPHESFPELTNPDAEPTPTQPIDFIKGLLKVDAKKLLEIGTKLHGSDEEREGRFFLHKFFGGSHQHNSAKNPKSHQHNSNPVPTQDEEWDQDEESDHDKKYKKIIPKSGPLVKGLLKVGAKKLKKKVKLGLAGGLAAAPKG